MVMSHRDWNHDRDLQNRPHIRNSDYGESVCPWSSNHDRDHVPDRVPDRDCRSRSGLSLIVTLVVLTFLEGV